VAQRNPRPNQDYSRKTSIRKPKSKPETKSKPEVDNEYNKLHSDNQPPSYGSATRDGSAGGSNIANINIGNNDDGSSSGGGNNRETIDNIVSQAEEQHKMINPTSDLKPETIEEEPLYDEPRKLRTDYNYSICKEICMTERTHLHDLEVIVCHLRNALKDESGIPESILSILYSLFDPIYNFHREFLSQLEQRVAEWENEEINGMSLKTIEH
jgi:hypothetical protein